MNKLIIFFLSVWLFGCKSEVTKKKERLQKSTIAYKSKVIQLGKITGKAKGKIWLWNKGDSPITIKGAQADCACTIVKSYNKVILPNDSLSLDFTVLPVLPGVFQQNVVIENDSKNEERILFVIRANAAI